MGCHATEACFPGFAARPLLAEACGLADSACRSCGVRVSQRSERSSGVRRALARGRADPPGKGNCPRGPPVSGRRRRLLAERAEQRSEPGVPDRLTVRAQSRGEGVSCDGAAVSQQAVPGIAGGRKQGSETGDRPRFGDRRRDDL